MPGTGWWASGELKECDAHALLVRYIAEAEMCCWLRCSDQIPIQRIWSQCAAQKRQDGGESSARAQRFDIPNSLDLVYIKCILVYTWTSNVIVVWTGVLCHCKHQGGICWYFARTLANLVLPVTLESSSVVRIRPSIKKNAFYTIQVSYSE